ncbi:MAG: hypothetical protein KatS3mg113_0126 [Planctomycetaceae bacterium]|nr:MAG: hypothetical protein KatS3mg113_0126 [Planctomycetaceae bacterium]
MSEITIKPPVLRETRYDRAVAWGVATFLGMLAVCAVIVTVWLTTRVTTKTQAVPVEIFELPGGDAEGMVDETLKVDSSEPETQNPTPEPEITEQLEIAETLETVTDFSEALADPNQPVVAPQVLNAGRVGSASGTGRQGLGMGPGKGGIPREQRWFIRFADKSELDLYAKQLDFFKIELAALLPDGRLVYVSQLSSQKPKVRYVNSGKGENRLYMTWQSGERRQADIALFQRAGVQVPNDAPIFHFYPPDVENKLAEIERAYRGRKPEQIKRTYFAVQAQGAQGFQFVVIRQLEHGRS